VPLHVIEHPIVHDALMELRDARTQPPAFRRAANRISVLLAAEALRALPSKDATVITPLGPAQGRVVSSDVVVVPVAGHAVHLEAPEAIARGLPLR